MDGGALETVHVFASTGRFQSFEEMRTYIDKTYTEDGDGIPSAFMQEVGLSEYEPGCIEAIPSTSGAAVPLSELLSRASYSDQWLPLVPDGWFANAAVCVFAPNSVARPEGCSLKYVGAFSFKP